MHYATLDSSAQPKFQYNMAQFWWYSASWLQTLHKCLIWYLITLHLIKSVIWSSFHPLWEDCIQMGFKILKCGKSIHSGCINNLFTTLRSTKRAWQFAIINKSHALSNTFFSLQERWTNNNNSNDSVENISVLKITTHPHT